MSMSQLWSPRARSSPPPPPLADERAFLSEERRALENERESFQQQQAVARRSNVLSTDIDARRAETVKAIQAAVAKARGPIAAPELPTHPLARACVLARQKADSEIDAADARWLSEFSRKLEATRELLR
jgi:hypothetical protein